MKKYTTPEVELLSFASEDVMQVSDEAIAENRTYGDNIFSIFGTGA